MQLYKLFFALFLIFLPLKHVVGQGATFAGVSQADSQYAMNNNGALIRDKQGNIYMQYYYPDENNVLSIPKLAKWDGQELYIFSKDDGLRYGVVRNFAADEQQGIWMASDQGLAYYRKDSINHYPLPAPDQGHRKITRNRMGQKPLVIDKDGYIWALVERYSQEDVYSQGTEGQDHMGTEFNELWYFKDGAWNKFDLMKFESDHALTSIKLSTNHKGKLLLAVRKVQKGEEDTRELYTIDHNSIQKEVNPYQDFLDGKMRICLENMMDLGNRLLFSYRSCEPTKDDPYEGFSILEPGTSHWDHYGIPGYENDYDYNVILTSDINNSNSAQVLKKDQGRGVWMGMKNDLYNNFLGGLVWFDYGGKCDDDFRRFSPQNHDFIDTVTFGTGRDFFYGEANFDDITGVARGPDGDLWVGTKSSGLFTIPEDTLPEPLDTSLSSPDQFNLQLPENDAQEIYPDTILEWQEDNNAGKYQLQIAKDSDFDSLVVDTTIETTSFQTSGYLENETQYHWRARGINRCYDGAWSETNTFKTVVVTPDNIMLNTPENGVVDVSPDTFLTWYSSALASYYQLRVADDSDFENLVIDSTPVQDTFYQLAGELNSHSIYFWKVRGINEDVPGKTDEVSGPWSSPYHFATGASVSIDNPTNKKDFVLSQNKPNPFSDKTTFVYKISTPGHVKLQIFNLQGEIVETILNENKSAGQHHTEFNNKDLSPGVYFYRLQTGKFLETKRMIIKE